MEYEFIILTGGNGAHIIFLEISDDKDTMTGVLSTERSALAESVSEKDRHHRFGAFDEESDVGRALGGME